MDQHDKKTAYNLAVHHGIHFWLGPCPLCGDDTKANRALVYEPGKAGRAVYLCLNCRTRFTRTALQVAHAVRVAQ